jgi:pyruvate ferredoxin oxidoreductase delta subunit
MFVDKANKLLKKAGSQALLHAVAGSSICPAGETGFAWREKKPVWDRQRCLKCAVCWLACPDAAVRPIDQGYYDSDLERCKGCGICAAVCWNDAITMAPEQK